MVQSETSGEAVIEQIGISSTMMIDIRHDRETYPKSQPNDETYILFWGAKNQMIFACNETKQNRLEDDMI